MSTLNDHMAGADLAREAVRALAHATIRFDRPGDHGTRTGRAAEHPEDTYWTLGDVLAMVRSLSQVVQQIGAAHDRNADRAYVDDDPGRGQDAVATVHIRVRAALLALERADRALNSAMTASSQISWRPPDTPRADLREAPTLPPAVSARPTPPDGPGL